MGSFVHHNVEGDRPHEEEVELALGNRHYHCRVGSRVDFVDHLVQS